MDHNDKILSSKDNALVKRYIAKAAGGKYVNVVSEKLDKITDEDLIVLFEAVKTVPFGTAKDESYEEKVKAWLSDANYKDSAPTLKLKSNKNMVPTILAKYGWKDTDKSSWSAFIQHFEKRLEPLVCSLHILKTPASSANYSRGAFMTMHFNDACSYAQRRTQLCLGVVRMVEVALGGERLKALLNRPIEGGVRSKELTEAISAARAKFPTKEQVDAVSEKMTLHELAGPEDSDGYRAICIAGAFPVEFRMIYQCKEARNVKEGDKVLSMTPADHAKVSAMVKGIHGVFARYAGFTELKAGDKMLFKDVDDPRNKEMFIAYKMMKAVVRSARRAINSNGAAATGPKRNYSEWQFTF